jgi:dolichyl-phosphate-mannose-protein mannosyltransferase
VRYNSAVGTETATQHDLNYRARSGARRGPLVYLRDRRLVLTLVLALLAGILAYQAPPWSAIAIGSPGDRLFLQASQGLGAADASTFYGDENTDNARSRRSRWTRVDAEIVLLGLGESGDLTLTLRAQGWPASALQGQGQPVVEVAANGAPIGRFSPTSEWADYRFRIPASVHPRDRLSLTLHSSATFTSADDPRPKGVRLEHIEVQGADPTALLTLPAPLPVAWLVLDGALCLLALVVLMRRPTLAFVLTTLLICTGAITLALARAWAAALLPWATAGLALLLLYARRTTLDILLTKLLYRYARGSALNYGLVTLAAAWLAYVVARASRVWKLPGLKAVQDSFPDSLLYGLLGMGLLLLILVRGREGLPRLSNAIVRLFGSRRGAPLLLLLFATTWIGYEAYVVAGMPYVGHADYADNAVVARNLVAGRGWVVDYITQFYRLYNGITHPQETWPLLQPVWIAPFFALFGANAWAAKIPNLLFTAALTLLIYAAGVRLWDRRVGLTAALIILTSYLFFRLAIYTTSDLAFTFFAFGAIYLLYRATNDQRGLRIEGRGLKTNHSLSSILYPLPSIRRWLVGSAVFTGLMLLQKPASGGLIALGMGLWFLAWARRPGPIGATARVDPRLPAVGRWSLVVGRLQPVVIWGAIALAILSPYVVRNLQLFHTPFYSTESQDAWLIEYTDWDAIYSVYSLRANPSKDELPNRSWILRWGFDRTFLKMTGQVVAVRNYLLPPWNDQSVALSDPESGNKALLFGMGAWLALLGALGALRSHRRLCTLLLGAFGPYTLFLIFYWHANEERYFVVLMPWLALLAGYALWRGYDRIGAIGDGRWTPVGLALAITAFVFVVQPSWPDIAAKIQDEPRLYAADLDAYTWLRDHAAPRDVVMTRLPWQLNWSSERSALMIPNTTDPQLFLRLARYYNVRYLVLDSALRPPRAVRNMLGDLLADRQVGFEKVYAITYTSEGRPPLTTEVYRFPSGYGGVAELRP